jgi:hypothetical protein
MNLYIGTTRNSREFDSLIAMITCGFVQDGEVVDVFLQTRHDTGQRVLAKPLLNFILEVRHIPGKAWHG